LPLAAEERREYAPEPPDRPAAQWEERTNGAAQPAPPERASDPNGAQQAQAPTPLDAAAPGERPASEVPNAYVAALALHACVPEGQKVRKDALLADAARKLGQPDLTRKVKTALNKALSAEHNAGRLKTDWQLVWKPRKK
jgi:hypothetical protein